MTFIVRVVIIRISLKGKSCSLFDCKRQGSLREGSYASWLKKLEHEVRCGSFCCWKREVEARGKFINDDILKYEGATTTLSFDPDRWSFFVVVSVVKSFGYDNFQDLWYCVGGGLVLENRLEELIDDIGVMHMANLARLNGEVHLYVVHVVSDVEVIHMLQYITNDEGEVEKQGEEGGDGVEVDGEVDGDFEEVHEVNGVVDDDLEEVHEDEEHKDDAIEVDVVGDGDLQEVHEGQEAGDVDGHVEELHHVEEEQDLNVSEGFVEDEVSLSSWSSSIDEGDVHENNECIVDTDDHGDRGLSDEEWKSEELLSGCDNDEEDNDIEGYGRFGTFSMPKTMVEFTWEVGNFFAEKQDILDVVKGYALENGRNIKFVKNDKRRLRLKCFGAKGECPWSICFGYMEAVKSWQLRTKRDNHTCSREFNPKLLDAKWLSKKLLKIVRENPNMGYGNDQMLPIAYAVVERENKDSWTWFLNLLIDDLCGEEGLLPVIQQLLPGVDQRATTATHPENWEREMKNIKDVNEDAFKHLIVIPPRRPKRKRRLEQWEMRKDYSRVSKGGLRKRCGLCREVRHNRSRCLKAQATQEPIIPSSQLSEVCQQPEAQT
ncbi:hypothetical protein V8G54_012784 [Vigna mungo]|uniref:Transposase MuDR plant domain-containing protein n=1 Tax=Vigna mungo TaxID=3915 RepID=A0AAQ3NVG6_VIGMU